MIINRVRIERGGWWYEVHVNGSRAMRVCKCVPVGSTMRMESVWTLGEPASPEARMAMHHAMSKLKLI